MRTGNEIKSLVEFQLDLPKNDPEFIRHSIKDGEAFFHTEYGFIHLSTVSTQEFYCKDNLKKPKKNHCLNAQINRISI